jgi:hypothetical protein
MSYLLKLFTCLAYHTIGSSHIHLTMNIPHIPYKFLTNLTKALYVFGTKYVWSIGAAVILQKLQEELNLAGLANFEKGAVESINPELPVDEQADLLPYDRTWEFPREKLVLGMEVPHDEYTCNYTWKKFKLDQEFLDLKLTLNIQFQKGTVI